MKVFFLPQPENVNTLLRIWSCSSFSTTCRHEKTIEGVEDRMRDLPYAQFHWQEAQSERTATVGIWLTCGAYVTAAHRPRIHVAGEWILIARQTALSSRTHLGRCVQLVAGLTEDSFVFDVMP